MAESIVPARAGAVKDERPRAMSGSAEPMALSECYSCVTINIHLTSVGFIFFIFVFFIQSLLLKSCRLREKRYNRILL